MRQRWRSLLFLHFHSDPAEIQELLPPGLTVDTFSDNQGTQRAWIGLVPFRMEGVTPRGVPEIPGIHAFPETNVRTYVHREGREPGVWFFSLDAANALACRVARRFFHLPYHEAQMSVIESGSSVQYRSKRNSNGATCDVNCEIDSTVLSSKPGSLEFFLVERYLLYSARNGSLHNGRVHHRPYPLQPAKTRQLNENLIAAAGIQPKEFESILFSPGVDVEVFGLQRVTRKRV